MMFQRIHRTAAAALIACTLAVGKMSGEELLQPQAAHPTTFVRPHQRDTDIRAKVSFRLALIVSGPLPVRRAFTQPGNYRIKLPATDPTRTPQTAALTIEAVEMEASLRPGGKDGYTACAASEVLSEPGLEPGTPVEFHAAWGGGIHHPTLAEPGGPLRAAGEPIATAFKTQEGIVCVVPQSKGYATLLVQAAAPEQQLLVRGRILAPRSRARSVVVDDLQFCVSQEPPVRNMAWKVTLRCVDGSIYAFYRPGLYRFSLPTGEGKQMACLADLREIKVTWLMIEGHVLVAEVADTEAAKRHGLQGRSGLEPDTGMLFVFDEPLRPTFLMKTVSFPLSIAFFRADGTIVSLHNRFPSDQRPVRPPAPVTYALETSRGWFEAHGVSPGARVEFQ